jgi:hypothetical protein
VPSGRRKCASLRRILEFSAENAEIVDWVADVAVRFELFSDEAALMKRGFVDVILVDAMGWLITS